MKSSPGLKTNCLKFVIAEWNPFTIFLNYTPPYVVVGSVIDIVDIITKKLGICYTLVRAMDTDWGMELPNGSWSGSIGILARNEANMSATVYSVSEKRSRVLDFAETVYLEDQTVSYLSPAVEPDISGFVKPYGWRAWLAILATFFIVVFASLFIQWLENFVSWKINPSRKEPHFTEKVGFHQIGWCITAMLNQSLSWTPAATSVRIVTGVWAVTAFILSLSYSCNLVAMLITPKLELPFNNFLELAKTDIQVWAPAGSRFNEALISSPPGSKLHDIQKNVILTTNASEGREGFFQGKWGIVDVRSALVYYLHMDFSKHGYCNFYLMEDGVLQTTKLSFGFPKGSKLKMKVDPIIRNLKEFGIIDHLFQKRVKNASSCLLELENGFATRERPLALGDFLGVFFVYFTGIGLSFIAFFLECVFGTLKDYWPGMTSKRSHNSNRGISEQPSLGDLQQRVFEKLIH